MFVHFSEYHINHEKKCKSLCGFGGHSLNITALHTAAEPAVRAAVKT